MLVRGPIDFIVALGLEEEMPGLAAHHGHEPTDLGREGRVSEYEPICGNEAQRAEQMQRLIDAAMVIISMIIPSGQAYGLLSPSGTPPNACLRYEFTIIDVSP